MNAVTTDRPREPRTDRETVLVWIDAREAVIVSWEDGAGVTQHVESDVPARVRATGQVRHAPGVRHGGGAGAAAEQHREEHLARFVASIADLLPRDADLLLVGPGTVREQLLHRLHDLDRGRPHPRAITCEPADRRTDRQLVAQLREALGSPPARREV